MISDLNKEQESISNSNVDWGKHYDHFEIEMREMYKTISEPQNKSHFEMLKQNAKQYLKADKVFCEIGFGAGLTLRYASKYFKKVYGLDISKRNVEYSREEFTKENIDNIELYFSDLMKFDKDFESKFDVISFIHGLEHFSKDDYKIISQCSFNKLTYLITEDKPMFDMLVNLKNEQRISFVPLFTPNGYEFSFNIHPTLF